MKLFLFCSRHLYQTVTLHTETSDMCNIFEYSEFPIITLHKLVSPPAHSLRSHWLYSKTDSNRKVTFIYSGLLRNLKYENPDTIHDQNYLYTDVWVRLLIPFQVYWWWLFVIVASLLDHSVTLHEIKNTLQFPVKIHLG